jgi:phosphatidylinositol dimannoside acyltransferase
MLLRLALGVADRLAVTVPARLAYGLADVAGDAWRRLAPRRRRLVAANLRRVSAATGRPTDGPAFRRLVRDAFRSHARYYLEILRARSYTLDRIDAVVDVPDWPEVLGPHLAGRPAILVSWHVGSFEPFATFLAARGLRPMAPIEEIRPRELFEFLTERRARGAVDIVPVRGSRRQLSARLREPGIIGIIGDRDLEGDGQPVSVFGHPTTMPRGPALLALTHGAAVVAGRCLRVGPDRFRADGEPIPVPATGDRRADLRMLVEALARRLEHDIAAAPEQWWGAFQPYWPDLVSTAGETPRT